MELPSITEVLYTSPLPKSTLICCKQDDLRAFHAQHFPHLAPPKQFFPFCQPIAEPVYEDQEEDLGYYDDGTRRTIRDEEIAIFRHTEIQQIIQQRRKAKELAQAKAAEPEANQRENPTIVGDLQDTPQTSESPGGPCLKRTHSQEPVNSPGDTSTPSTTNGDSNKKYKNMKSTRAWRERKKQQQARKRRRLEMNRRSPSPTLEHEEEEAENDEWTPWNQATGPDAPKEAPVDLEY
jgi:hypothetical protein